MKWSRNTVKKCVMKCFMKYAHKKVLTFYPQDDILIERCKKAARNGFGEVSKWL